MRIVTVGIEIHTGPDDDNPFEGIDPRVTVEGDDGFPGEIVLAAAVGGLKSATRAVEAELEKYRAAQGGEEAEEDASD